MAKHAILVEDDMEQVQYSTRVLSEAGFVVATFMTAEAALVSVGGTPRPVDLVVLDRRLPRSDTDEPTDDVGDDLLVHLLDILPDSPFVVFTGHSTIPHVQFATRGRGVISVGASVKPLDRVCPLEKEQTIEFEEYVSAISSHLDRVNNIEVSGLAPDSSSRVSLRLLKRVALEYGGTSIAVEPLIGGLAEMPVWRCSITNSSGQEVAAMVVKQSDGTKLPPIGGLHSILPSALVAAPVAVIDGLCDGKRAQVMQLAGGSPASLMALLVEDEAEAARQLGIVAKAMREAVVGNITSVTIAELAQPLSEWEALVERLVAKGVDMPPSGLFASTRLVAQHGDLHPGNVLVVDGKPNLIDFDNEVLASRALDPVTALLSPVFHRNSPLRGSMWPSPEQCEDVLSSDFARESPCPTWVALAQTWLNDALSSEREVWALVLAYAGRQMKYPDVYSDASISSRALAVARAAAARLASG